MSDAAEWTLGRDSNPRDLALQASALPLGHPEKGGVGYGIRTRVNGVKVRSPRPLADNPTQELRRTTLSENGWSILWESNPHRLVGSQPC